MNRCKVCDSPSRLEIEKALIAGVPYRKVARGYGVSEPSLYRHRRTHLHQLLLKSTKLHEVAQADSLVTRLQAIHAQTLEILAEARRKGDGELALKAINRAEAQIELSARLLGEIRDKQVNIVNTVTISPEDAERIARVFLERRGGLLPPAPEQVMEAAVETEEENDETQE